MRYRLAALSLLLGITACDTVDEPVAPVLSGCTVSDNSIELGDEITFAATINSDALESVLISVDWGDGESDDVTRFPVVHTYDAPGSFTPTATAFNALGTSTCQETVEVTDPFCADVQAVTVFFPFGSALLNDKDLEPLREGALALRRCTDLCLTIDAYADDVEAEPVALSQTRAEAVQDVIVGEGVARTRTTTQGLGVAPGSDSDGSPGPGDSRARRAIATPGVCPQ